MSKRPFPLLSYHADWLIVDKAWVDARKQMALVKIKDRYFEIELDSARAENLFERAEREVHVKDVERFFLFLGERIGVALTVIVHHRFALLPVVVLFG